MAFITRDELLDYSRSRSRVIVAEQNKRGEPDQAQATVFLSHSHDDRELIEPAINFLASFGVSVYVDWQDPQMPSITNGWTAHRLQLKIVAYRRFVMLATENSLASRWVPWELGYADGKKSRSDIAIFPIQPSLYREAPNEYIQVYPRIEQADNDDWYVFAPGETRSSVSLRDWLLRQ
jgi:hypothetical protein